MKIGIVLPQYRQDVTSAMTIADAAEAGGVDGVFVSDHLWRPTTQTGPALSAMPLLSAVAARTSRIRLGTLVARVAVLNEAILLRQFKTLHAVAGNRLIAGVGIGDAMSKPENLAYGIDWPDRSTRLDELARVAAALRQRNIEVWLGGKSPAITRLSGEVHLVQNYWDAFPEAASEHEFTWGGKVVGDVHAIHKAIVTAQERGASWAVLLIAGSGNRPEAAVDALLRAKQH